MRTSLALAAGLAALAVVAGGPAGAAGPERGKEIFAAYCAACHGAGGKGDGRAAALFRRKPQDLTRLAAGNDGVFPFSEVYQAIDGRRDIVGHGTSEMPIWGRYFMQDAIADPRIDEKNAREIVQGRILSVVWYLQSIQAR